MTWATKRQTLYLSILAIVFLGIGFWIGYPYLQVEPTCFDSKQNGDETGVDCGGSCQRACAFEVDDLSVIWSRVFKVTDGRYNAVAYLENQNKNAAVYSIRYRFRFADENNIYIGNREGEISIPPAGRFAIFEPAVGLGHSVPVYASFEFLEIPDWVNVESQKLNQLDIAISNIELSDVDTKPRMSALVENNSLYTIPDLNLVTILYDTRGNAVSVSNTYLEVLRGEESKIVNYTWPEPFPGEVVVKEVIPMYNVFTTRLE